MAPEKFKSKEKLAEALFLRYKRTMTAIAMSFMGNTHDADDIVQLSMIKVINNIDKIDDIESDRCRHFIMVITRNTALNEINKKKNRKLSHSHLLILLIYQNPVMRAIVLMINMVSVMKCRYFCRN